MPNVNVNDIVILMITNRPDTPQLALWEYPTLYCIIYIYYYIICDLQEFYSIRWQWYSGATSSADITQNGKLPYWTELNFLVSFRVEPPVRLMKWKGGSEKFVCACGFWLLSQYISVSSCNFITTPFLSVEIWLHWRTADGSLSPRTSGRSVPWNMNTVNSSNWRHPRVKLIFSNCQWSHHSDLLLA